ncbi:hypothetical protein BP6252_09548 [Coleophoma cylindrospora]|uniref:Extracellular serine-rich protein n=1 Tax=Coleophoma cylindrospora TaxID=1849047 RepID=A0A3D8R274_9HELO|nr:hypothetical protein BP6252_09548 [Coleophoma cylindrospora]
MSLLRTVCSAVVALLFSGLAQANSYKSTALVLALDDITIVEATYLLEGYGIPWDGIEFTQTGQNLPMLEASDVGYYGLFIIVAQLYSNGASLLTDERWQELYDYQVKYGVRMVHLNVAPSSDFGVKAIGSCCSDGAEQNLTLVDGIAAKEFPTAGLKTADMSTLQLFHFPASILDANTSTTTAIAEFQPNSHYSEASVAAVINKLDTGREQMAFFLGVGNWSTTSTYLGHAWVHWGYRGTYPGYRRINLQTQVDDLFLETIVYNSSDSFRLRFQDLEQTVEWLVDINRRLPTGSSYFPEFGFNANGNLIYTYTAGENLTQYTCDKPVFTTWEEATPLEYIKPLGDGHNQWSSSQTFDFTGQCLFLDPLTQFLANTTNRDSLGLVSHTFTHLGLNNATYNDALIEISFNLAYAELMNFTNAAKFSGSGLIPPAITGLHNGDVIRAWSDNGLWNAIGDNTRPILRNPDNFHWPLITNVAQNGYGGFQITPRFATRMYFNCDQIGSDVAQWIATGGGTENSTIYDLLDYERTTVGNQLLSLYHDPYMFHQPNIRSWDVEEVMIAGRMQKLSLLEMWVETVTAEMARLTTWPIVTLKHDHIAAAFNRRMLVDACNPIVEYSTSNGAINGFTVSCDTDSFCDVPIPVTVGQKLADTKGFPTEQIGSDPMTVWVKLDGTPISFAFA